MSHDPLCQSRNVDGFPCYTCALIARVRADERTGPLNMRSFDAGYALALRDAVDAVKAMCQDCDDIIAAIQALADTPQQQAKEHINPVGYDPHAADNRP